MALNAVPDQRSSAFSCVAVDIGRSSPLETGFQREYWFSKLEGEPMQNSQDTSASLLPLQPLLMSSCSAELGKPLASLMQAQKKFDPSD
jgi:hypothetical protein